jgi:hypothetical protein
LEENREIALFRIIQESLGNIRRHSGYMPAPSSRPPGTYTVTATPYSGAGGTGTAGTSLTVTITVVSQFLYFTDGAYAVAGEHEGF